MPKKYQKQAMMWASNRKPASKMTTRSTRAAANTSSFLVRRPRRSKRGSFVRPAIDAHEIRGSGMSSKRSKGDYFTNSPYLNVCAFSKNCCCCAHPSLRRDRPGGLTLPTPRLRQRQSFFAHAVVTNPKSVECSARKGCHVDESMGACGACMAIGTFSNKSQ